MRSNVALIGFMGTGKTAVGRVLAEKLGRKLLETDRLIEERAGKSITEIFNEDGEIAFRELEITVTREVATESGVVIACGGGIVLNQINIDRLRAGGITVYLTASPTVILDRTSGDVTPRPLLATPDPAARVTELIRYRRPFYERAADITVNTSRIATEVVADLIIRRLEGNESYRP